MQWVNRGYLARVRVGFEAAHLFALFISLLVKLSDKDNGTLNFISHSVHVHFIFASASAR